MSSLLQVRGFPNEIVGKIVKKMINKFKREGNGVKVIHVQHPKGPVFAYKYILHIDNFS